MKTKIQLNNRTAGILLSIFCLFIADVAVAQTAAAHSHRATRRRTAVVVSSATHAKDEQAAAEQQAASEQQTTTETAPATEPAPVAEPVAAAEPTPAVAPAPASAGELIPIGTVVSKLPGDCEPTPVDNVQYYHCGANYYRTAYQENNLVYVTVDPPK